MIDANIEVYNALKTILPTYYELIVSQDTPVPCITYIENNNMDDIISPGCGYSQITYTIKLWDTIDDYTNMNTYALQIDTAMRSLNFSRTGKNELTFDNMIQKIFTYRVYSKETF